MVSRALVAMCLLVGAPAWAAPVSVACLGDSITRGYPTYDNITYPGRLEIALNGAHPGGYTVGNFGVDGSRSSAHLTTWTNSIRGKGYDAVVILSGVNDLIAGISGATVWGNIDTIVTQALADGMVVVLVTTLPWRGYSGYSFPKQDEQDILLASIRARSGVIVVDAYPSFETTPGSDMLNASYGAGDSLHLDTDGDNALVSLIMSAWGV